MISNPRCLVYFLYPHPHSTQSHAEPSRGFGRGCDDDDGFVRSEVASLSSSPCQARSPLPCEAQCAVCGLHLHRLPETRFCINSKSRMAQIWTLTCCVALGALPSLCLIPIICRRRLVTASVLQGHKRIKLRPLQCRAQCLPAALVP